LVPQLGGPSFCNVSRVVGWPDALSAPTFTGVAIDDSVSELLAKAKQARAMAERTYSPEYKRLLADIAADYERLASCRATILNTQQRLAESRRLLDDLSRVRNRTVR
jgi:hypothetical protein